MFSSWNSGCLQLPTNEKCTLTKHVDNIKPCCSEEFYSCFIVHSDYIIHSVSVLRWLISVGFEERFLRRLFMKSLSLSSIATASSIVFGNTWLSVVGRRHRTVVAQIETIEIDRVWCCHCISAGVITPPMPPMALNINWWVSRNIKVILTLSSRQQNHG